MIPLQHRLKNNLLELLVIFGCKTPDKTLASSNDLLYKAHEALTKNFRSVLSRYVCCESWCHKRLSVS